MKDLKAMAPAAAVAIAAALVLLALSLLLETEARRFIVPQPDSVAEQLVRALETHRFSAAHEALNETTREEVSRERLRELLAAVESSRGSIEEAHGGESEEAGDEATATVDVRLASGEQRELKFSLSREHGLWKINSIAPLEELAAP